MEIDDTFRIYIAVQLLLLFLAVVIGVGQLRRHRSTVQAYLIWLTRPWRTLTFAAALVGITLIAPYTHDPYWDYVDAPLMATATWLFAPFVVSVLGRAMVQNRLPSLAIGYCAAIAWCFSASWSYDLWLVLRDGQYPLTWSLNIPASTTLFLFGGGFWQLQARSEGGVSLAFLDRDWPSDVHEGRFAAIAPLAGLVALFIGLLMLSSVFGWV